MTDIDRDFDRKLEDRLRRTLASVAATSAATEVTTTTSNRRRWVIAMSVVMVLGGFAAIALFAARPGSDNRSDAAEPGWYRAIAPVLPDGFDHIAIFDSADSFVSFEAIELATSKVLILTVERTPSRSVAPDPDPGVPLEQVLTTVWTDLRETPTIVLPDGRKIGVGCVVIAIDRAGPSCPPLGGVDTDPEQLRALALALAELPVSDLPPPDPRQPEGVGIPTIVVRAVATATDLSAGRGYSKLRASLTTVGEDERTGWYPLQIRVVTDFLPPIKVGEGPRQAIAINGGTITWRAMPDGSIWVVSTTSAIEPGIPDAILDAATDQMFTATVPTLPVPPATADAG